jgi:hypothetical protein
MTLRNVRRKLFTLPPKLQGELPNLRTFMPRKGQLIEAYTAFLALRLNVVIDALPGFAWPVQEQR